MLKFGLFNNSEIRIHAPAMVRTHTRGKFVKCNSQMKKHEEAS